MRDTDRATTLRGIAVGTGGLITDETRDSDGTRVYSNSGVVAGRVVWGRIVEQHDHLDTQKVLAWDERVAARSAIR